MRKDLERLPKACHLGADGYLLPKFVDCSCGVGEVCPHLHGGNGSSCRPNFCHHAQPILGKGSHRKKRRVTYTLMKECVYPFVISGDIHGTDVLANVIPFDLALKRKREKECREKAIKKEQL